MRGKKVWFNRIINGLSLTKLSLYDKEKKSLSFWNTDTQVGSFQHPEENFFCKQWHVHAYEYVGGKWATKAKLR